MSRFALPLCLFLTTPLLFAGDPWPHPTCDKEHSLYTSAPSLVDAAVHWINEDVAEFPSTVIDGAGNIFVFVDDVGSYSIVTLDPATGEVVDTYASGINDPTALALGGGMLYALADKALMAWQIGNTTMQWSVHPEDFHAIPVADESGTVCTAGYGSVYCYDAAGSQNWSYPINASSYLGVWPTITSNAVFIPYDSHLLAVNLVGGTERFDFNGALLGYDGFLGPTADPDGDVWAGFVYSGQIWMYAEFDGATGSAGEFFKFTDKSVRLHCITDGSIFIFQGGRRLYVWDVAEEEPDVDLDIGFNSSPITCASDTVYLGDDDGWLFAYGLDGNENWRLEVGDATSSTAWFKAVDAAGNLYVPLQGGRLAKVGPDNVEPDLVVSSVVISGTADDLVSPPPEVLVDGTPFPVNPGDATFSAEVSLTVNPQTIEVRASDANANETIVNIDVSVN